MHDPHLHLFVDDQEVHHAVNVLRVLNLPQRRPDPVVAPDQPWERGFRAWAWGSVAQDPDGLLRMWYMIYGGEDPETGENGGFGYAQSRDGIHWEKPSLGIVSWRGSKENNFFYSFGPGYLYPLARLGGGLPVMDRDGNPAGVVNHMDGLTVVRDDEDPDPLRRYKLFANMQDHRMWAKAFPQRYPGVKDEEIERARKVFGQYLVTSSDGMHFTREPIFMKGQCHGDYMMVARDHRNEQWWMNERPRTFSSGFYCRSAGLCTSRDLLNWTSPTEPIFVPGSESGFGRLWEWHGGMTPFNYGNQDLGFLEKWNNVGGGDACELISHRDGEAWRRVKPGDLFLDHGPEGSFDRVLTYPLHNPPMRVGNKLHIYYTGYGIDPQTGNFGYGAIGVALIGLDRFAGLAHRRGDSGLVVTKPLTITRNILQVNVEPMGGEVRVAIKNPDFSDLPGYSLDECSPIASDQVRAPVRWRGKTNLSEWLDRKLILHFSVRNAVLYSYRLVDREDDI
ncbi:MAG: hypothetical protein HYU36_05780 [Planctomycetes bacterium]|nr:hypothetical protein [Planctomycetota bacterium]